MIKRSNLTIFWRPNTNTLAVEQRNVMQPLIDCIQTSFSSLTLVEMNNGWRSFTECPQAKASLYRHSSFPVIVLNSVCDIIFNNKTNSFQCIFQPPIYFLSTYCMEQTHVAFLLQFIAYIYAPDFQ